MNYFKEPIRGNESDGGRAESEWRVVTTARHAHRIRKYGRLKHLFCCHNSKLKRYVLTPY